MTGRNTPPVLREDASVLVAGGSGFIGRHLCRRLREEPVEILATGTGDDGPGDVPYAAMDVRSSDRVREVVGREGPFDYVFNLAGYIDHSTWRDGGGDVYRQHAHGAENLVEATYGDELRGFVQVGSSDEYGPAAAPQSESDLPRPISPYSAGKLAATNLIGALGSTEGFPGVTSRLFLVYGPGQGRGRFLPQLITSCLEDEAFPTTPGEQLRDFCYVRDVADGLVRCAASARVEAGETFNLASGRSVSIRKVTEIVREQVGRGDIRYGEMEYREEENMELYADVAKAENRLGWSASTSLREGLRSTIRAYRRELEEDGDAGRTGV